jgi:hypothetical protein
MQTAETNQGYVRFYSSIIEMRQNKDPTGLNYNNRESNRSLSNLFSVEYQSQVKIGNVFL